MSNSFTETQSIIKVYKAEIGILDNKFSKVQHTLAQEGFIKELRNLLISRSKVADRCLKRLWKLSSLDHETNIALFAVGGYGRREFFPESDLDILILFNSLLTDQQKTKIEFFIQQLWDLGVCIGQSVRSFSECLDIAQKDHTVLTTLLNSRKIVSGSEYFLIELKKQIQTNSVATSEHFFKLKKQEYTQRHNKHADTEYNLEPNIKEAPGGLRDIHTLLWVSKYTLGFGSLAKLFQRRILSQEELDCLQTGYDFIASVRYCLHIMVGRDENRLLFDYQKRLATILGFQGQEKNEAVEQFMKTYYRHASTIAAIVDLLLENVEEEIIANQQPAEKPINQRFAMIGSKIAVRHEKVFKNNPSAILEMFYLLGQSPAPIGVRANTIRLLRKSRHKINESFRHNQTNTKLFMQILQSPYKLFTQLQRMKRYGVLGRYLPEFGQVIGQMQYDLFHVYTVDAHALLVVQNMRLLRHSEARKSFPIASKIIHDLSNRTLLYIAGLYHDIAKGRNGDHSILGAQDVNAFCQRHQLNEADTQLITWLVLDHLIMSVTAQKTDISDFRVIEEFAQKVEDQERLDYLYLLTICDIGATNPKLLNPWRLSLINQLYLETSQFFKRQLKTTEHWSGRTSRVREKAVELLRTRGIPSQNFEDLWDGFGEDYFSKYSAQDIAWHTEAILKHGDENEPLVIAGLTQESTTQVYTQIFIYMNDCPYLFVNSVSVLSELGLNILDARVLTSKAGSTLNTYIVDDDGSGIIANTPQIYNKICTAMTERLKGTNTIPEIHNVPIPRRHKHFDIQTRVCLHNLINEPFCVISIETLDRPGLLTLVGSVIATFELSLHSAKILTFGERAEDFFSVSSKSGRLIDAEQTQALYTTLCQKLQIIN